MAEKLNSNLEACCTVKKKIEDSSPNHPETVIIKQEEPVISPPVTAPAHVNDPLANDGILKPIPIGVKSLPPNNLNPMVYNPIVLPPKQYFISE